MQGSRGTALVAAARQGDHRRVVSGWQACRRERGRCGGRRSGERDNPLHHRRRILLRLTRYASIHDQEACEEVGDADVRY